MKKVRVKIPAKLNLTLDITGKTDKFHNLDSVVCSINLYEVITAKKRKDNKIIVRFVKSKSKIAENNNAYLSAKSFVEKFNTCGVEVVVKRIIPDGAGLGSSSADIAGVLTALKKLFNIKEDVSDIASTLGSDSVYMLNGGFARIRGKGDNVKKIDSNVSLFGIILKGNGNVNTAECYKVFDELNDPENSSNATRFSEKMEKALICCDYNLVKQNLSNDLTKPAIKILKEIEENLAELKKVNASEMTGSGSAIYSLFATKKERDKAYKVLYKKYKNRLIKIKTV